MKQLAPKRKIKLKKVEKIKMSDTIHPQNIYNMKLDNLKQGILGITPEWCSFLYQAGIICLNRNGHETETKIGVNGDYKEEISITWGDKITQEMQGSWNDQDEATEYGAMGMSLILTQKYTGYTHAERSAKGTGFDYWLGNKRNDIFTLFKGMCRLEISGIFNGDDAEIRRRTEVKIEQTKKTDHLGIPAIVSIIEFSRPKANFVKR